MATNDHLHKKTDESLLGKIVKCKDCGFTFKVSNGSQPVQWDWMQNGEKKGPVDVAGLKELAKSGHLKPTDMIQRLGADWVVASQVKGLFPESTSVAASPPVPKTTSPEPAVSAETNKIQFQCSGCGKGVSFPSDKAGKTDKCPFCGVALQVPQTPDYYKNDLMAACAAIGKAVELRDNGESERANKGFELAETWVRKVLQNPCLPFAIEAEANCMLGTCCKSVGRFAEAQTAMEKGLALGRSKGFAVMEEWLYADDLGDVYDTAVHLLIIEGQFNQAKALLAQVEGFVSHYKSLENFDRMRHEGFILLARAMITVHEDHLDSSIQYFGQLLSSPYKEYFASHPSLTFVIGQASRNIGQIYHMAYGRSDEAIPYIEESLKYFQGDTEEFASAQTLLDRVRRKRGLIQAISSGWGQIAWGISLDDFLQTFSRASQDDDWWLSGEKPGDLAGFAIDKVKYAFNPDGQLYLIAFFPNDPSRVFADLPYVFGAPDKPRIASWTYGDIEVSVKGSGNVVTLTNVAFDDDASGYKKPLRESAEAKLSALQAQLVPAEL